VSKPGLGVTIAATVGAAVAVGVGYHFGGELHTHVKHLDTQHEIITYSAAAAFFVLGSFAARRIANALARVVAQADRASASVIRLAFTIVGIIAVALVTLAMLHIGVSQLLLGGAITGIVVGIAAQQSLGNMFAGIVLLLARPFRVGDHIRVRTGSLGGAFEGDVMAMGLTYVTFSTEEGTTLVPNLTLLASGIVRSPRPLPEPATGAPAAPTASSGPQAGPAAPTASSGPQAGPVPPVGPIDPGTSQRPQYPETPPASPT